MLEAFLLKPFFAVILATISCSLLGVFVLWKKLFYFGDAMSHSMLFGVVLGAFFPFNQIIILIIFAVIFALLTYLLSTYQNNSKDNKTLIVAILSYFFIAMAFLLNDFFAKNIEFDSVIFGDVLAVSDSEITMLTVICMIVIIYIFFAFNKILLLNLNEDLAKISAVKTAFWNLSFLTLLAITVALCVQIVGVFLMTALLVLPAAIARIFSKSPKQMLFFSALFGVIISASSFVLAGFYDLKIGATIIAIFCIIFFLGQIFRKQI